MWTVSRCEKEGPSPWPCLPGSSLATVGKGAGWEGDQFCRPLVQNPHLLEKPRRKWEVGWKVALLPRWMLGRGRDSLPFQLRVKRLFLFRNSDGERL